VIIKGPEPASLTAHRKTAHSDYNNYNAKADLRVTLTGEQKGLCCYCMGRIQSRIGAMKIEHWRSQARYEGEQLLYRNLLGACLGNEGRPISQQHCDTRKGDLDLEWNPANPAHHIETRLMYESDGTIRALEAAFDRQLDEVLNLNLPKIKNNRKSVLEALLEWWKAEKPVSAKRIRRQIDARTNGAIFAPYSQVAVWWLRLKL
jgi:uncharacterized protein (TIGR02646 family)